MAYPGHPFGGAHPTMSPSPHGMMHPGMMTGMPSLPSMLPYGMDPPGSHPEMGAPAGFGGGRPRVLTAPAPSQALSRHGQFGGHAVPPSMYSPQTPTSPFDAQQAQAMHLQQMQLMQGGGGGGRNSAAHPAMYAQVGGRSQSMSMHPNYAMGMGMPGHGRRGSFSIPGGDSGYPQGMDTFDENGMDDDYGSGMGEMAYQPRMDDETAAYIRSGTPFSAASQVQPSRMAHGMQNRFQGSGSQSQKLNDQFDIEQEVTIKTKTKGRGSMSGRTSGHGMGQQEMGMSLGFNGESSMQRPGSGMGYQQYHPYDAENNGMSYGQGMRRSATPS